MKLYFHNHHLIYLKSNSEKKMKKLSLYCIAFLLSFQHDLLAQKNSLKASVVSRPVKGTNSFYLSNKAPLEPLSFIKLPVGTIKPGGWI